MIFWNNLNEWSKWSLEFRGSTVKLTESSAQKFLTAVWHSKQLRAFSPWTTCIFLLKQNTFRTFWTVKIITFLKSHWVQWYWGILFWFLQLAFLELWRFSLGLVIPRFWPSSSWEIIFDSARVENLTWFGTWRTNRDPIAATLTRFSNRSNIYTDIGDNLNIVEFIYWWHFALSSIFLSLKFNMDVDYIM